MDPFLIILAVGRGVAVPSCSQQSPIEPLPLRLGPTPIIPPIHHPRWRRKMLQPGCAERSRVHVDLFMLQTFLTLTCPSTENNLFIVKRLLKRTDMRNPDPTNKRYTSLAWTATLGNEETFEFLLSEGHDDREYSKVCLCPCDMSK